MHRCDTCFYCQHKKHMYIWSIMTTMWSGIAVIVCIAWIFMVLGMWNDVAPSPQPLLRDTHSHCISMDITSWTFHIVIDAFSCRKVDGRISPEEVRSRSTQEATHLAQHLIWCPMNKQNNISDTFHTCATLPTIMFYRMCDHHFLQCVYDFHRSGSFSVTHIVINPPFFLRYLL